jgi:phosphatidylglycerophosphate synthase
MLDGWIRPRIDPPLALAGKKLAAVGISADAITIGGCLVGIAAAAAVAFGHFTVALVLLIVNRVADGLDGAVARATRRTDRGAFLDISLDFVVYAAVPLGFAVWNAPANALPAAFLLASYIANGCAFLAFSTLAERRGLVTERQGLKSIYYLAGLAEGFETIVFMMAVCLLPEAFALLATIFAVLCCVSAASRLALGWRLLA